MSVTEDRGGGEAVTRNGEVSASGNVTRTVSGSEGRGARERAEEERRGEAASSAREAACVLGLRVCREGRRGCADLEVFRARENARWGPCGILATRRYDFRSERSVVELVVEPMHVFWVPGAISQDEMDRGG